MSILSEEMIPESGKLFKENRQSRSLDICAASATQCPNFRGLVTSKVTWHHTWNLKLERWTSWCVTLGSGLSMLEVWTVASVLQGGFCVIIGCWGKLFGCFERNFGNTGRMEMFSIPGGSDLVESFIFDHVYLILLSGENDLRRWINMIWSTNVENISSRGNSFGLESHFCQQNKHTSLKKIIIWTTCKAVNMFSNIARVKYSIVTSH